MAAPDSAVELEECDKLLNITMERLLNLSIQGGDDNGGDAAVGDDLLIAAASVPLAQTAASAAAAPDGPKDARNATASACAWAWADMLVDRLMAASSLNDARACARGMLEEFGSSVHASAAAELETASKRNAVLRKAVAVLYRAHMKQRRRVAKLEEKVKSLEARNYALNLHLRQADLRLDGSLRSNRQIF